MNMNKDPYYCYDTSGLFAACDADPEPFPKSFNIPVHMHRNLGNSFAFFEEPSAEHVSSFADVDYGYEVTNQGHDTHSPIRNFSGNLLIINLVLIIE